MVLESLLSFSAYLRKLNCTIWNHTFVPLQGLSTSPDIGAGIYSVVALAPLQVCLINADLYWAIVITVQYAALCMLALVEWHSDIIQSYTTDKGKEGLIYNDFCYREVKNEHLVAEYFGAASIRDVYELAAYFDNF